MKKILSILLVLLVCRSYAQLDSIKINPSNRNNTSGDFKTIFQNVESMGGYGAFTVGYLPLGDESAMLIGGRGGVIFNHFLSMGFYGYGFFSSPEYNEQLDDTYRYQLAGGCGGIYIEPILGAKQAIHLSFPLFIGGGGINYSNVDFRDNYNYSSDSQNYTLANDRFFIIEPGAEIEFNLFKNYRMSMGGSYRFASKVNLEKQIGFENVRFAPQDVLNGFTATLSLKLGLF